MILSPDHQTLDNFRRRQAEHSDILLRFFEIRFCGYHNEVSEKVKRDAASLAQETLHCATKGRVKPAEHLCIGMGMKRIGQPIIYNVAEGTETENASSITDKDRVFIT